MSSCPFRGLNLKYIGNLVCVSEKRVFQGHKFGGKRIVILHCQCASTVRTEDAIHCTTSCGPRLSKVWLRKEKNVVGNSLGVLENHLSQSSGLAVPPVPCHRHGPYVAIAEPPFPRLAAGSSLLLGETILRFGRPKEERPGVGQGML